MMIVRIADEIVNSRSIVDVLVGSGMVVVVAVAVVQEDEDLDINR